MTDRDARTHAPQRRAHRSRLPDWPRR